MPVNGITYLIEDGLNVYIINVTYTGGMQQAADKYAKAFIKTVQFSN